MRSDHGRSDAPDGGGGLACRRTLVPIEPKTIDEIGRVAGADAHPTDGQA